MEKEMLEFIDAYENMYPLEVHELSDASAYRRRYDRIVATIDSNLADGVVTEDHIVDGTIPIRIFRANNQIDEKPCCIFIHGGGWSIGSLDSHAAWASDVCLHADVTVISIDYRLAPEHPYPAAFNDCLTGLNWVLENAAALNINPHRVVLYGDSAGGNLCAALTHHESISGNRRLRGQVLVYPALHSGKPLPSWIENQHAPVLSLAVMQICWNSYMQGQAATSTSSPLLATEFIGIPSSWIIAAENDPLYDDAKIYHGKLLAAEVSANFFDGKGLVHGCFRARRSCTISKQAFEWSVQGVRDAVWE